MAQALWDYRIGQGRHSGQLLLLHRIPSQSCHDMQASSYELTMLNDAQRLFGLSGEIDMPHSNKHMAAILLASAFGVCCRNIGQWFHNKGNLIKQVSGCVSCTSNIELPQVTGTWCRLFQHVQLWMSAGRSGKPLVSLAGASRENGPYRQKTGTVHFSKVWRTVKTGLKYMCLYVVILIATTAHNAHMYT